MDGLVANYAVRLLDAIRRMQVEFQGVSLNRRVAFLLPPGKRFMSELRAKLSSKLHELDDPTSSDHKYELVTAETFAKLVGSGKTQTRQQLVIDSIDNFDGLECLIVFGVHLDGPTSDTRLRSRICRSITRGQMLSVIVNENVRGGWLEWLQRAQLKNKHDQFDADAERAAIRPVRKPKVRKTLGRPLTETIPFSFFQTNPPTIKKIPVLHSSLH
jgi:hypothetical protein